MAMWKRIFGGGRERGLSIEQAQRMKARRDQHDDAAARDALASAGTARSLLTELVALGKVGYLAGRGDPPAGTPQARAKEIGRILNELGGFELMQEASRFVRAKLGYTRQRELEYLWDGIGTWQA